MSRVDAWYMVRRRARDAGIETAIGNHSFRAISTLSDKFLAATAQLQVAPGSFDGSPDFSSWIQPFWSSLASPAVTFEDAISITAARYSGSR